jgi:hypothetical protein
LKLNEVSPVLSDPTGHYIYKLDWKGTESLDAVKNEISNNLRGQRARKMMKSLEQDPFDDAGCIAPPNEVVALITPTGDETQEVSPCFDHPTLTDILNTAKISWRYYSPLPGIIWNAPTGIEHICVPNAPPPNGTACTGADWTNNVIIPNTQVLTDIANGQLASVSWVIPSGQASDHSGISDGSGPSWVASVVNAMLATASTGRTLPSSFTWDDWGGWYDHVSPTITGGPGIINSYEYGFRVPLIVGLATR